MVNLSSDIKQKALFLVIAGIIFIVSVVLHPDETQQGFALNPLWLPVHIAITISFLLIVFGVRVFFSLYKDKLGGFGRFTVNFVMVMSIFMVGLIFYFESLLVPVVAANSAYSSLLDPTGPLFGGSFGIILVASFILLGLSFVLLGILILVKRTVNPIAGILFFAILLLVFSPPLSHLVGVIGGVVLGLGLVWTGIGIMQKAR